MFTRKLWRTFTERVDEAPMLAVLFRREPVPSRDVVPKRMWRLLKFFKSVRTSCEITWTTLRHKLVIQAHSFKLIIIYCVARYQNVWHETSLRKRRPMWCVVTLVWTLDEHHMYCKRMLQLPPPHTHARTCIGYGRGGGSDVAILLHQRIIIDTVVDVDVIVSVAVGGGSSARGGRDAARAAAHCKQHHNSCCCWLYKYNRTTSKHCLTTHVTKQDTYTPSQLLLYHYA